MFIFYLLEPCYSKTLSIKKSFTPLCVTVTFGMNKSANHQLHTHFKSLKCIEFAALCCCRHFSGHNKKNIHVYRALSSHSCISVWVFEQHTHKSSFEMTQPDMLFRSFRISSSTWKTYQIVVGNKMSKNLSFSRSVFKPIELNVSDARYWSDFSNEQLKEIDVSHTAWT